MGVVLLVRICIDEQIYDIDGILFDKDGTLLDFHTLWMEWSKDIIDAICLKMNLQQVHQKEMATSIGVDWQEDSWDVEGPLAIGTTQDLITLLAHQLYVLNIPWNTAFKLVTDTFIEVNRLDNWKKRVKEMPGLKRFVKKCYERNLHLGVVTSDDHEYAVKHLKQLGIHSYFQAFIGGDQVTHGKPFPESAELACAQMNVNPRRMLVIGDSDGDMVLGNNIRAMANIGVVSNTNETKHFHHADHLIRSYDEITFDEK